MSAFKTLLSFLLGGAMLGQLAGTLLGRLILPWWSTPGQGQALCNCPELVHETVGALIRYQLIGATAGGVLFLALGIWVIRRRGKRASVAPSAGPTAPGQPAGPTSA